MARLKSKVRIVFIPPSYLICLLLAALISAGGWHLLSSPPHGAAIALGFPLQGARIVIDPSHGGIDPGTHYNNELTEKEISLSISLHLRRLLELAGAEVLMTRESDQDVSRHYPSEFMGRYERDLLGRIRVVNESQADLFVSVHVDYCVDPTIRGAITFYKNRFPENKYLAEIIQKNVNPVVAVDPQPDEYIHQDIKEGDFFILNDTTIPGVLIEVGFMSSPHDRELLKREEHRKNIARGLFMGIAEYIYTRDKMPLQDES